MSDKIKVPVSEIVSIAEQVYLKSIRLEKQLEIAMRILKDINGEPVFHYQQRNVHKALAAIEKIGEEK